MRTMLGRRRGILSYVSCSWNRAQSVPRIDQAMIGGCHIHQAYRETHYDINRDVTSVCNVNIQYHKWTIGASFKYIGLFKSSTSHSSQIRNPNKALSQMLLDPSLRVTLLCAEYLAVENKLVLGLGDPWPWMGLCVFTEGKTPSFGLLDLPYKSSRETLGSAPTYQCMWSWHA